MTLRWGILGAGSIARSFSSDLRFINERHPNSHAICSVASRESQRASKFAHEMNIPNFYDDYRDLAADDEVEIVYVANVQSHHRDAVLMMLDSGKHVLCEKPFALNAKQAVEMIEHARAKKLFLMEAMWTRFLPHIISILEELENGTIGEIISIDADHGQWVYRKKDHRLLDPSQGGGALLDLGVYPISLAHLFLGKPSRIDAQGTLTAQGVDRQVGIVMSFDSGALATLHTTIESVTATRATIAGTKGRIEIDRSFYTPTSFTIFLNDGGEKHFPRPSWNPEYVGLGEQLVEVARCIEAGVIESPMRPLSSTLEVLQIMDKIRHQIGLRYPGEVSDSHDSR